MDVSWTIKKALCRIDAFELWCWRRLLRVLWTARRSNESALSIRWPKDWRFSLSISPSNDYSGLISFRIDWVDLLAVQGTLKNKCLSIAWLQSLSAVILEPKKTKSVPISTFFPCIFHEVIGPEARIFVFWMLSFKPAFSLYYFTFIKRLFASFLSDISARRQWSKFFSGLRYAAQGRQEEERCRQVGQERQRSSEQIWGQGQKEELVQRQSSGQAQ